MAKNSNQSRRKTYANDAEFRLKGSERSRLWRKNNPEKVKEYYIKNKEKIVVRATQHRTLARMRPKVVEALQRFKDVNNTFPLTSGQRSIYALGITHGLVLHGMREDSAERLGNLILDEIIK